MKHLIMTGMFFVLAFAPLSAEVIQTINFNPARLGQYERLKVSEKATFQGGLTAQSMQVRSAGTVSINESESDALAYDIPLLDGRKGKNDGAAVLSTFPATPTLDFGGACFSSLENCVSSSSTGNLNVKFNGGAARFAGPSGYNDPASRINQITTNANQLRLESVYATVKGKLNITGVGTYSYRNLDRPTTPLRLAGNWVPLPSTDGVGARTLKWETRKTVKHPDKGGESVKILVLAGKNPTPPACTAQTCSPQPCPSGQTGQINYTWSQSQCKCVESSRTCKTPGSTECTPGAKENCGDYKTCLGTRICGSNGKWGDCKRGRAIDGRFIDTYCGMDGTFYWCGPNCVWSDSSNSCVYYTGPQGCPDNATAHNKACAITDMC